MHKQAALTLGALAHPRWTWDETRSAEVPCSLASTECRAAMMTPTKPAAVTRTAFAISPGTALADSQIAHRAAPILRAVPRTVQGCDAE